MANPKTEFRALDADLLHIAGGAMLLAQTDKGEVVIYLTQPSLQKLSQKLVHQTKPEQPIAQ